MEAREALLAEQYRPMYRSFRNMGLSEAAAFEATIGRQDRTEVVHAELDIDRRVARYESMGMSRSAAEHAATGRAFGSFQEARQAEIRRIRQMQAELAEDAKRTPKPPTRKRSPRGKPTLQQLVESAIARALEEQGTGTTREQLTERARRLVEADIADIQAGRRPSDRYQR